ncbi:MAG: metal ABC transporter permease [Ruminococcaceae bacterium]|nr:metal ABC transporter permease [Oscillospiraceae bacterium]
MEFLGEFLTYPFARRAIIAGLLLSVSAALLGVNLVLKRFSMLGDGLSHVSFGAAAVGLACGAAPLQFSIPIVIVAAFLLLRLKQNSKINGDAATAIVSSSALAVGITVASLTTGMNTDITNYMFGSVLALGKSEVMIAAFCGIIIIAVYILFYQKIFTVTFDEDFASVTGVKARLYNSINAIMTALIVVIGMRIMGALLISSIITFPALSSMRICKHYKCTVIVAAVVSVISFVTGILLSFTFDIPAGAAVVLTNLAIFLILSFVGRIKKI